jgi:hypothetical protein
MIDLRKGCKTTATIILYSSHSEMIVPFILGDRVSFRRYIGYCETSNGGRNRNYVFDRYTNEPSYTIQEVFERLSDTTEVREFSFEGIDQLPIAGDATFQIGSGVYNLSWG